MFCNTDMVKLVEKIQTQLTDIKEVDSDNILRPVIWKIFPQTWASTALGFGGIGGASITTAYTTVIEYFSEAGTRYRIFFGGRLAYDKKYSDILFGDIENECLVSVKNSIKYPD
jgi:hypothetical protein